MDWRIIAVPIVGAVIGYITNWVAVKMLFYPHYEKKIWGHRVPFTPGVIPRGQGRLARAVGQVVEKQLLTPEVLGGVLLSEETCAKLRQAVVDWTGEMKTGQMQVKDAALLVMEEDRYEGTLKATGENLSAFLYEKILAMDPAAKIVEAGMSVVREKLADSMFGFMLGGSFMDKIGDQMREYVDAFIKENLPALLEEEVAKEVSAISDKRVGEIFETLEKQGADLPDIIEQIYRVLVAEKLPVILTAVRFSDIVEDRINAMDVAQVEELVLVIMKKELGAVINIGALIGFILGLVNVAILMLPA